MTEIKSLIERLEKAPGPSRELDKEIAESCGWERNEDDFWRHKDRYWAREAFDYPPNFTSSIDAALTLVPQKYDWYLHMIDEVYNACVGPIGTFSGTSSVIGATPAIALCIAALRARIWDIR